MVAVDDSSLQADSCQGEAKVSQGGWLGMRFGSCMALFYIHQMNWVDSQIDFVTMTAP